jgi:hypothetical protein
MSRRTFTWLFLLPLLLFLCYTNTHAVAPVAPPEIEAGEGKPQKAPTHTTMHYLLPEEPFTLERPAEKYPDRKYKLADKHRFNSGRYKTK